MPSTLDWRNQRFYNLFKKKDKQVRLSLNQTQLDYQVGWRQAAQNSFGCATACRWRQIRIRMRVKYAGKGLHKSKTNELFLTFSLRISAAVTICLSPNPQMLDPLPWATFTSCKWHCNCYANANANATDTLGHVWPVAGGQDVEVDLSTEIIKQHFQVSAKKSPRNETWKMQSAAHTICSVY